MHGSKRVSRIIVFVDVLMLLVLTLITMINPPADPSIDLKPKMIMTAEWDGEKRVDIDSHVILPTGEHMSYLWKDVGGRVVLTRDDMGIDADGQGKRIPINMEVVEFFVLEDGAYKIAMRNFHSYDADEPIDVVVKVLDMKGYVPIVHKIVTIEHEKDTVPVVTIHVKDKKVVEVDLNPTFQLPRGQNGH